MSKARIWHGLRRSVTCLYAAGAILIGFSESGVQAAFVSYTADQPGWTAAANALGPIVTEDFADTTLIPELVITFGDELPGNISGGVYNERTSSTQSPKPLLTFTGLGASAFGATWNFGESGTNLRLFFTFANPLMTAQYGLSTPQGSLFIGFVSTDSPILTVLIDEFNPADPNQTFQMDDLMIVAAVPVPAALPLFLSAIAALVFVARRRKRSVNA